MWLLLVAQAVAPAALDDGVCLLSLRAARDREVVGYRLAEMFFGSGRDAAGGAAYHLQHFPHSVAAAYLSQTERESDWGALRAIVQQRAGAHAAPAPDVLVVHLDTAALANAREPAQAFLAEPTPQCFEERLFEPAGHVAAQPLSYFERLRLPAVRAVVLVSTADPDDAKSQTYARAVAAVFRRRGLDVATPPQDPGLDAAFLYMAQARYLVPGGGALSAVCAGLVWVAGGEVVGEPVTRLRAGQVVARCWRHSAWYVVRRFLAPWAAIALAVLAGLPRVTARSQDPAAKYGTFPGALPEVRAQADGPAPEVFALDESGAEEDPGTIEQEYDCLER